MMVQQLRLQVVEPLDIPTNGVQTVVRKLMQKQLVYLLEAIQ